MVFLYIPMFCRSYQQYRVISTEASMAPRNAPNTEDVKHSPEDARLSLPVSAVAYR